MINSLFVRVLVVVFVLHLFYGCTEYQKKNVVEPKGNDTTKMVVEYAKGFSVSYLADEKKEIRVQNQNDIVQFSKIYKIGPSSHSKINYPVKSLVAQSSPHWGLINELGQASMIKGISLFNHVYSNALVDSLKEYGAIEVGAAGSQNIELLMNLSPDLILESSTGSGFDNLEKWEELGLPVVLMLAHMEQHPLGRAEWMKYLAAFMGIEEVAEDKFNKLKSNYLRVKNRLVNNSGKPKVFIGYFWKDNWYIPGGKSYLAQFVKDAGGDYLNKDNHETGNTMVGLETAVELLTEADIWLNPGYGIFTFNELIERTRIPEKILSNVSIYNCNNRVNTNSRNDYWESGFVRPDIVLEDLYKIFYPRKNIDAPLFYFRMVD